MILTTNLFDGKESSLSSMEYRLVTIICIFEWLPHVNHTIISLGQPDVIIRGNLHNNTLVITFEKAAIFQ